MGRTDEIELNVRVILIPKMYFYTRDAPCIYMDERTSLLRALYKFMERGVYKKCI